MRKGILPPAALETGLLALALLWYWSCWVLLNSGKNGLDVVPWPWLLILAFGPLVSAALAFAMHLELRRTGRAMRAYEIVLVVVATPQFLGDVYVWFGLLHYM
ncbi:MAG: hypothetical protein NT154_30595 [Verrucomicrobia bacterium]|nr:hypothetical protein [Verrucomicrobiota bacterium]